MKTASSIRELARGVGRGRSVVQRWVQRPDWNQARTPPWDIEKARTWSRRLGPNPADMDRELDAASAPPGDAMEHLRRNPLSAAKLKLTVVRAQKLEIEKAILTGEFIPRRDVEDALVRRVHAARAAFEALPRQLAGALAGLDEDVIERTLDEHIAGVLRQLSEQIALPPANMETD